MEVDAPELEIVLASVEEETENTSDYAEPAEAEAEEQPLTAEEIEIVATAEEALELEAESDIEDSGRSTETRSLLGTSVG